MFSVLFILAQYFQSYGGAFMSVPQSRAPRLVVLTREGFVGDATTIARGIKYINASNIPSIILSLMHNTTDHSLISALDRDEIMK